MIAGARPAPLALAPRRRWSVTLVASGAATLFAAAALVGMTALFAWQSLPAFRHAGTQYVTGKEWYYADHLFGAASMIYGTVAVAAVALVLATPVGLGAAIFAAEFLPRRLRFALKIAIELLVGVPSVVYGLLGILFLRNYMYDWLEPFEPLSGDSLLTAGVLLAVMILPTLMMLADDALAGVPAPQRQAARGLGLSRVRVVLSVSLPQARKGLCGAVLLALGRALGETIAVFLVVGRQDNQWPADLLSLRPLIEAGQTLSSKLGGSETNIARGDPLHWAAVAGLGLLLMGMVGVVTLLGSWLEGGTHDA